MRDLVWCENVLLYQISQETTDPHNHKTGVVILYDYLVSVPDFGKYYPQIRTPIEKKDNSLNCSNPTKNGTTFVI